MALVTITSFLKCMLQENYMYVFTRQQLHHYNYMLGLLYSHEGLHFISSVSDCVVVLTSLVGCLFQFLVELCALPLARGVPEY